MDGKLAQPPDQALGELADAQHGPLSHVQIIALVGRGGFEHRVRSGRLHRVHRGVYVPGRRRLSRRGVWMAAVLACGDGAVLSHRSAAALWGMAPRGGTRVDVTVPGRGGRGQRDGLKVHRARLAHDVITSRDGIPVTTPMRTLVDLADTLDEDRLHRAVTQAEIVRLLDVEAIRTCLAGRRGAGKLLRILTQLEEPAMIRSDLERRFRRLCTSAHIPQPEVNALVAGDEVDFLWRRAKLVVEADGRETHLTRAAFETDRARDARLTVLGFRVVRFTYRQIVDDPGSVGVMVRALLSG